MALTSGQNPVKGLVFMGLTLFHGLCDLWYHFFNNIVNSDLLNDEEPNSDHRHLTLTLKFDIHTNHMQDKCESQRNLLFHKSKMDLFLKD